jgi:hypothetical protein
MSKESIEAWVSKIPKLELNQPLIILGGTAYTPNQVLSEVSRGTALGNQLQEQIEKRQFTAAIDKYALALLRLRERYSKMPSDARIAHGTRVFSPQELLREIESGTPVGRSFIEAEVKRTEEVLT